MTPPPRVVACPCGNGYAERREQVIRERVTLAGTPERGLQRTYVYRHDGCPIGGHVVTVNGELERKAGPLFTASSGQAERLAAGEVPLSFAADGGERP